MISRHCRFVGAQYRQSLLPGLDAVFFCGRQEGELSRLSCFSIELEAMMGSFRGNCHPGIGVACNIILKQFSSLLPLPETGRLQCFDHLNSHDPSSDEGQNGVFDHRP